jgi:hypothetical protein
MPDAPNFDRGHLIDALSACPIVMIPNETLRNTYSDMRELLLCALCESDRHHQTDLVCAFLGLYTRAVIFQEASRNGSPLKAMETCKEVFARASLYHETGPKRTERYHHTMRLLAK